ncbi:MAG: hypothetical protein FWF01_00425 [Alphaproteobacteria bacterium]|nr:hypothetical protein [Alphaproteobacteria bacterium]
MQTGKAIKTVALLKLAVLFMTIAIIIGITFIGVRVSNKKAARISISHDTTITAVTQCDRYVCALLSDGRLVLFHPQAGVYNARTLATSEFIYQ